MAEQQPPARPKQSGKTQFAENAGASARHDVQEREISLNFRKPCPY